MKSFKQKFLDSVLILGLSTLLSTRAYAAMPDILPLDQVSEGMHGQAYTVVDSSGDIRSFDVDIVGTIDNGKGSNRLIMAKASGDVVDKVGGVLQGMSGSPVYVNGKLIGALSAGIKDMNPFTFFITPIEDMIKIWRMPDSVVKKPESPDQKNIEEPIKEIELKEESQVEKDADDSEVDPEIDPEIDAEDDAVYFFSGFDENGANFLQEHLSSYGLKNLYAAGNRSRGRFSSRSLEAGDPVGVTVVYGDFSLGATGTVTAVDDENILAFGHSFLKQGNVNYFMTDADVVGTISGVSNGMKISQIGNIIGRVNQDRTTGISGIIGKIPDSVPIHVNVFDYANQIEESYDAKIAYNEKLIPALSAAIAYSSMTKTSDYLGDKTATLKFSIDTNAVNSGKIERTNMFYNVSDVGQVSVAELLSAVNVICSDVENRNEISDVHVDVTIENGRKTATIISAVPDKMNVKPGEKVTFTTTIQPYRAKREVVQIEYTVPKNQPEGLLNLDVRGGSLVPITQAMLLQQAGIVSADEPIKPAADQLRELVESGKNNEIIIAPGASTEVLSEREQKRRIRAVLKAQEEEAELEKQNHKVELLKDKEKKSSNETRFATNYIIENVVHATLKVER